MRASLRMKRALIGTAVGAMVLGLMPAGAAFADEHVVDFSEVCEGAEEASFEDLGNTHDEAISCMAAYEVAEGFDDGTYGTTMAITRQQFASLVARFVRTADEDLTAADDHPFTDVESDTHGPNIAFLYNLDIVEGTTATTFEPNATLTRAQAASITARALVELGLDLPENADSAFTDLGETHADNIEALAELEIILGQTETIFGYNNPVQRGQIASFLARSAQVLLDAGLWDGELDAPAGPNEDLTANPELLTVSRSGDIVTFEFDQNVPGKSLDFFNTAGTAGSLVAGDEVSYYTGLRLYDVEGTAYYPYEAGIFGDEVRARYDSATVVAAAVRAGVYEDTVQNAVGRGNPASDFPLAASAVAPAPIDPYFPQLTFVGNLRDTDVTPAEILVDYTFTFSSTSAAASAATLITANLGEVAAADFALVGSAGQVFRAVDFESLDQSGATVTATVVMDPAIEDVPVSELRRGFVEEDTFDTATIGLAHILLSTAYQSISDVNGTTADPDLRAVERGPGANQLRFIFDEGVSVPDGLLDNPDLYTVVNNSEERATPDSIGRSLIAADDAEVMIATFTTVPAGYTTISDYLDTVTAASVDVEWFDVAETVVARAAARGTNQVGSQQLGWSLPAQVLVTPVQPDVPSDPIPGITELPDLVSVTKSQNEITGNWRVTFAFDQTTVEAGTEVDFSLYDAEGVRFSGDSRDIAYSGATYTFGPDFDTSDPVFTNEQIAAAVLGTVQDADADLIDSGFFGAFEPRVTEGHDPVDES